VAIFSHLQMAGLTCEMFIGTIAVVCAVGDEQ